jgi:hypothetical protein
MRKNSHFLCVGWRWALLGLPGLVGCSLAVDDDRVQCSTNSDCAARGKAFIGSVCNESVCEADPKWSCLAEPPKPSDAAGPFQVEMQMIDLINRMPVAGVRVDLCRKVDVDCTEPVMTTQSDASGAVTLSVEAAFSGYAWLQSEGHVPTLYFFNPPVDRDQQIPPLSLSTPAGRAALLGQLGADTARGEILVTAQDCLGHPASGVTFGVSPKDPAAIGYYLVNGLPTNGASATDATGYGGFMNLSRNATTITATLEESQTVIGTLGLVVRGGSATWSRFAFNGN